MNRDRIEGNWKQLKGRIQREWGQLTDDDLDVIQGDQQRLAGKLQERYGLAKEDAERKADDFLKRH